MRIKLPDVKNHRKILVILFLIGLVLRSVFTIYKWKEQGGTDAFVDAWDYIEYANVILSEGVFTTSIDKIDAYAPPGYPILLAGLFKIFGENYSVPIILNVLLGALMIPLIYVVARKYFNDNVAILSATWTTFYVKFYEYMAEVIKENLLYVYVFVGLLLFHRIIKRLNWQNLALFIVFVTIWVHTDERYISLLPVFAVFFFVYHGVNKRSLKFSGLAILLFCILQIPWLVRNFHTYNRPVYLTERVGLFTDRFFGNLEQNSLYNRNQGFLDGYESFRDSVLIGESPVINSSAKRRILEGMELGLKPYPYSTTRRYWESFKYMWRPLKFSHSFVESGWKYKGPWSFRNNILTLLVYGSLIPFLIISLFLAVRRKNKSALLLWSIIMIYTAFHVVTNTGIPRYRIPIDSLIIMLSFYSLSTLLAKRPIHAVDKG